MKLYKECETLSFITYYKLVLRNIYAKITNKIQQTLSHSVDNIDIDIEFMFNDRTLHH